MVLLCLNGYFVSVSAVAMGEERVGNKLGIFGKLLWGIYSIHFQVCVFLEHINSIVVL